MRRTMENRGKLPQQVTTMLLREALLLCLQSPDPLRFSNLIRSLPMFGPRRWSICGRYGRLLFISRLSFVCFVCAFQSSFFVYFPHNFGDSSSLWSIDIYNTCGFGLSYIWMVYINPTLVFDSFFSSSFSILLTFFFGMFVLYCFIIIHSFHHFGASFNVLAGDVYHVWVICSFM